MIVETQGIRQIDSVPHSLAQLLWKQRLVPQVTVQLPQRFLAPLLIGNVATTFQVLPAMRMKRILYHSYNTSGVKMKR